MQLALRDNLPYVSLIMDHNGRTLVVPNVLIDTGSGTTIIASDIMQTIGITPLPEDALYTIRGVGGSEVVFSRRIAQIQLEDCIIQNFEVEIGGMDYGFDINGIIGMDFLTQTGALLNLHDMTISFT